MDWKNTVWEGIGRFARLLPPNWLESGLSSKGKLGRIARLGLIERDLSVKYGLASGVKFNAGAYNPDTSLGTYEMPVQEVLSQYLKSGSVFYDIGANVGFFTILGAKLVGHEGKVYAFEPESTNIATLRRNIQLNNFAHVSVIEKAVSKTTGVEKLWLTEYSGSHTLAPENLQDNTVSVNTSASNVLSQLPKSEIPSFLKIKECITVDTVSIDSLLQQQEIEPPTLVKIDVEGAEIDVLQGMSQTLEAWKPIVIYEVDDENQEGLLDKREKIEHFLLSYGYKIESLIPSYREIAWNVGHAIAIPA